jgi:hypothetical protein
MGAQAIRLMFEPVRSLDFSSISGTYMSIGSALANPIRVLLVQNGTDASLMYSADGINDHFQLPAGGFLLLDVTANKTVVPGFYIAEGTTFYVKEIGTPSTGTTYVTVIYGIDRE